MASRFRQIIMLLLAIAGSVTMPALRVSAASTPNCSDPKWKAAQLQYRNTNDVLYYDQCSDTCSTGTGAAGTAAPGGTDGQAADGLTAEQVAFLEKYHDIAEKLSIEYGIPWETVTAQGMLESGSGSSNFARERNNFFGIGAFDANPNNAYSYATPEEGWRGYYQNIAKTPTYRQHGVFTGDNVTDPYAYLNSIKAAGYATDPNYVSKNAKFIDAINKYAKTKGWDSSADLAKKHPEMASNAAKYAQGGAAGSSGNSGAAGGGGANCSSASGGSAAASGPISSTATAMGAWGGESQACYERGGGHGSTEDLKNRIDHHFAQGYGVDCSGFTRAVIYQSTGKDPGAMDTNTMCASPATYEHIPRAQAQPGDLAIDCPNHVEVITAVNSDGSFATVGSHSSGCGPGKGPSPSNYQGTGDYVLRYKG